MEEEKFDKGLILVIIGVIIGIAQGVSNFIFVVYCVWFFFANQMPVGSGIALILWIMVNIGLIALCTYLMYHGSMIIEWRED